MPELPEVETALRGVTPYLKGFTIEKNGSAPTLIHVGGFSRINNAQKRQNFRYFSSRKYLIIHTEKVTSLVI